MRAFVQCMQRELIAPGSGLDECGPVLLQHGSLRLVRTENIAERSSRAIKAVLFEMLRRVHSGNFEAL